MNQIGGDRRRRRVRSTGKRSTGKRSTGKPKRKPRGKSRRTQKRTPPRKRGARSKMTKDELDILNQFGRIPAAEEDVTLDRPRPPRATASQLIGQSLGLPPDTPAPRPRGRAATPATVRGPSSSRPSGRAATPPRATSLSPRYASQPQPQPEPSAEEGAPSPTPRVPKGVTAEPSKPPSIWWKNRGNGERSELREKLENRICNGLVQIIESVSKGDIELLSLSKETPLNTMLRTVNEKVGSKGMTYLDGVIGGKEWGMEENSQHPPGVLSGVVIDYKDEDVTRKKEIIIQREAETRADKFLPYFEYYYRKRRPRGRGKQQNLKRLTGALATAVTRCLNEAQSLCSALGWKDTSEIQSTDIDMLSNKGQRKAAAALAADAKAKAAAEAAAAEAEAKAAAEAEAKAAAPIAAPPVA